MAERECRVLRWGHVPYADALAEQTRLVEARARGETGDLLIFCEHPPTYTLGTAGDMSNLLMTPEQLQAQGISVQRIDRGGDITFHGPGQIVGYPILQLERLDGFRTDVIEYVRRLEKVIIAAIGEWGVIGKAIPGLTGVWVDTPRGEEKIAAIGVRVTVRAVTKHGFALNANTDLRYFGGIIPCGIRDKGVTSLEVLLDRPVDEEAVTQALIHHFARVFSVQMV